MVGASTLRPGVTIRRTGATDSKPQSVLILFAAILLLPLEAALRRREPRRVGDDAAGFLYAEKPRRGGSTAEAPSSQSDPCVELWWTYFYKANENFRSTERLR
jgi:hypothetical protein